MRIDNPSGKQPTGRKSVILWTIGILLIGCGGFAWWHFHQSPQQGWRGGMTPERRAEMQKAMAEEMKLTPEQQQKMQALMQSPPKSPEEARAQFEEMQKMLTPEQREAGRQMMQRRMEERLNRDRGKMSASDFEAYKEKMKQRMEARFRNGPPPPPR